MSLIPTSSNIFAIESVIPSSVITISMFSSAHTLPNPLFPNLEESARIIVLEEASIIFFDNNASSILELVIPHSLSIPSTPRNSLEHVKLLNA